MQMQEFECMECQRSFNSPYELYKHKNKIHGVAMTGPNYGAPYWHNDWNEPRPRHNPDPLELMLSPDEW